MKISFVMGAYLVFYAYMMFGLVTCWLLGNPHEKFVAFVYGLLFVAGYSFLGWCGWRSRR